MMSKDGKDSHEVFILSKPRLSEKLTKSYHQIQAEDISPDKPDFHIKLHSRGHSRKEQKEGLDRNPSESTEVQEISANKHKAEFSKSVNANIISIFAVAGYRQGQTEESQLITRNSCPNLVTPDIQQGKDKRLGLRASDSELLRRKKFLTDNPSSSHSVSPNKNQLTVPELFITSHTHSKTTQSSADTNHASETTRRSLNNIHQSVRSEHCEVKRTVSLPKPDRSEVNMSVISPSRMFRNEFIAQLTDYLFIGSIESAYNERLLCRLEIESLVDISNRSEMQIPSHKKTQCPCLCQTEYKHFRSRLIISVEDDEKENIEPYFEEVCRFIEGARRCGKKVLLYSYEGKSRAPGFAMQYLMSYEGLLLRQVFNLVKKQRPCVSINPGFLKTLEQLEKSLFPEAKHSVNICNEYLNVADPQAIKCAWIDC
ncbi:hypothetical protein CHS0354_025644 [Potamilus streckersoni]|uniref:protein-tyrosine-phosphatase n=1 Tax=Potamilus streckersoni TaxID=2493646 RepID=A0AAE0RYT7_9BIVA|nr:hypothetical protein CHS0354_025644 [Potamilus streckersoni]